MQVGLTFNFKHGETEDTPDPSGTGSSIFQAEHDVMETIERARGVFEILQKLQPGILLVTAGGCAGSYREGCLPSTRNSLNIPCAGLPFIDRICLVKAMEHTFSFGHACIGGKDGAAWVEDAVRPAAPDSYSLN